MFALKKVVVVDHNCGVIQVILDGIEKTASFGI